MYGSVLDYYDWPNQDGTFEAAGTLIIPEGVEQTNEIWRTVQV